MRNRRNEANTLIGILKDESQKALSWLEDLGTTNLFESPADIKARKALNNTKETCEKLLELLFPDKTASGNLKSEKFVPCDWDNKIEKDKCQKCGKIPPEMFYRRTKKNPDSGVYWCKSCADQWEEDNAEDDNIRWQDYTARLDVIAGELEAVDPRLALALDRISDRLEMAKEKESFSTKTWKWLEPIVAKNIKEFHDKANKLDQAIRSEEIWDTLDKAAKAHGEDVVQDKLDQSCKEWNNLHDPDYISADTWLEDIKKLEAWIKKAF